MHSTFLGNCVSICTGDGSNLAEEIQKFHELKGRFKLPFFDATYFSVFKLQFVISASASAVAPEGSISFSSRLWEKLSTPDKCNIQSTKG